MDQTTVGQYAFLEDIGTDASYWASFRPAHTRADAVMTLLTESE